MLFRSTTTQESKTDQQPKEPITFGNAPTTTVTKTIWKTVTQYMTKLPIITFEGPNDWTFEAGKPYDFEEYHNGDMIKIRLPSHWSKDDEDYEPRSMTPNPRTITNHESNLVAITIGQPATMTTVRSMRTKKRPTTAIPSRIS